MFYIEREFKHFSRCAHVGSQNIVFSEDFAIGQDNNKFPVRNIGLIDIIPKWSHHYEF